MKLTTTRLKLPTMPRVRFDVPPPVAAAITTFGLIAIAFLVGQIRSAQPAAAALPTPQLPIVVIQKEAPAQAVYQVAPAPAAAPVAPRYVVGYDSPNGRVLGAIVAPEASAIVARFGDEWLQTTHDGAPLWIRASDIGMSLSNVAPAPAAPAPAPPVQEAPIAPIVAAPAPVQVDSAPPPAAEQPAAPPVPTSAPAPTPLPIVSAAQPNNFDTDVERSWAVEQWRSEHCVAGVCHP